MKQIKDKTISAILAAILSLALSGRAATAQQQDDSFEPQLPEMAIYKAMLEANRQPGWVQFRNYGDRQLIYFTTLQSMRCRLSEIRYSVNSEDLGLRFPLGPCDIQQPFNIPDDPDNKYIYQTYQPDEVETLTIQVVWKDGSGSEIVTYQPCDKVGEATCARIRKVNKPANLIDAPTPSSGSR